MKTLKTFVFVTCRLLCIFSLALLAAGVAHAQGEPNFDPQSPDWDVEVYKEYLVTLRDIQECELGYETSILTAEKTWGLWYSMAKKNEDTYMMKFDIEHMILDFEKAIEYLDCIKKLKKKAKDLADSLPQEPEPPKPTVGDLNSTVQPNQPPVRVNPNKPGKPGEPKEPEPEPEPEDPRYDEVRKKIVKWQKILKGLK